MNAADQQALAGASLGRLQACLALADPAGTALPGPASDAAREAMALAGLLGLALERARAHAWLCGHLHRAGHYLAVQTEAAAALPLLRQPETLLPLAAERRELLRVLTLSACETGHFDTALDAAHALVRDGADLADRGPALTASLALAACFERMGDPWQAVRVLGQALAQADEQVPVALRLMANNGMAAIALGVFHRLDGAAPEDEARAMLLRGHQAGQQALALMRGQTDPVYEVAINGNLGELKLHLGELGEAIVLLRHAHRQALARGYVAYGWRVMASIGAWLLATHQPEAALAAMQALLAKMGDAGSVQSEVRAHHVAYLACKQLGQPSQALAHFEQVERLERRRALGQLKAQSELFVTRAEAQHAQWQAEQARLEATRQQARAAAYADSAERDPLTGLGNRRHLDRRSAELLPVAQHEGWPLALAQIDIDHFKSVNDQHGHAVGDQALLAMSQLLGESLRSADVLVRHGGEEFVLLLPGLTPEGALEVCERLRQAVEAFAWSELCHPGLALTVSIGLAMAPPYALAALLQRADGALYRAKRGGRNQVCVSGA